MILDQCAKWSIMNPPDISLLWVKRKEECVWTHHGLLTLYAGAVEAQSRDAVLFALDIEDTFIVPLTRLGLWKIPG